MEFSKSNMKKGIIPLAIVFLDRNKLQQQYRLGSDLNPKHPIA
ncbi:hypothetical protein B14911_16280 [Bacillus sp. NRRL B-14911]|nr:hypothetical protein B14911_16280 [Bacillus sp. NRRL B-14911]